ncbi:DUF3563 domain-containing protein [Methylobrevis albus]|uniref:DUF3563 domain-containing protein n=1 Tax=Methylobrevis albus TaxID=2793297 RepID=A0A931I2Y4_9HYPH|nr:DUF3563 domain-containing protein [Methylobrevis albus]MBH0238306.1 DUF3563 domain-containing protein [Methylobrevis albus]
MFGPIKKLRQALRPASQRDIETGYLNEARDAIDLEHRQREIDRGLFRRPQYRL